MKTKHMLFAPFPNINFLMSVVGFGNQLFQKMIRNKKHHRTPPFPFFLFSNVGSFFYKNTNAFLQLPTVIIFIKNPSSTDYISYIITLHKKTLSPFYLRAIVICK